MRIDTRSGIERLIRTLRIGLGTALLGEPDQADGLHWWALWQGDGLAD